MMPGQARRSSRPADCGGRSLWAVPVGCRCATACPTGHARRPLSLGGKRRRARGGERPRVERHGEPALGAQPAMRELATRVSARRRTDCVSRAQCQTFVTCLPLPLLAGSEGLRLCRSAPSRRFSSSRRRGVPHPARGLSQRSFCSFPGLRRLFAPFAWSGGGLMRTATARWTSTSCAAALRPWGRT